jgi:PAS domain S-box-containing protein
MPTGQYPFIDIAVHEKVRTRFAAGDAVVVLSQSLTDVLWVNGPGARLFGHAGLYDFMDAGLGKSTASYRQIETAARSILDIADKPSQSFVMRTGSGFRRPVLPATMERIRLADGNHALLLTASLAEPATTPEAQAAFIIDGFEDLDTHAAVLDGDGAILRSTPSFARLDMDAAVRAQIVKDVAAQSDRLVKHPVRTALGYLPAAIARITDEVHLLIAIEMSIGNLDPAPREEATPNDAANKVAPIIIPGKVPQPTPSVLDLAPRPPSPGATDQQTEIEPTDADDTASPPSANGPPLPVTVADGDDTSDAKPVMEADAPTAREKTDSVAEPRPEDEDQFVFNPRKRPVRFVWKIDAAGIFSEISGEFSETVGPNAADIEGRKFTDVAQVFNIDPDHAITDLLRKRDTWSGKTVLWPVQGTDLRVPVDIAALPTYSRDREFDGFRGFGIIRSGDAESDPERIGLALVNNPGKPKTTIFDQLPEEEIPADGDRDEQPPAGPEEAMASPDDADEAVEGSEAGSTENAATNGDEKPAIKLSSSPGRRQSDKVIRLEERRGRPRDGLSTAEKLAFREIAQRLGQSSEDGATEPLAPFGKRQTPLPADGNDNGDQGNDPAAFEDEGTASEAHESATEPTDTSETDAGTPPVEMAGTSDDSHEEAGHEEAAEDRPVDESTADAVATEVEEPAERLAETEQPPARENVLTPAILELLPTPIVVHDGTSIFYINEEFRLLTGYLSTTQLNEAGGLNALFGGQEAANDTAPPAMGPGTLTLHLADTADTVSVRARLRSIAWNEGHALMLALSELPPSRVDPDAGTDGETVHATPAPMHEDAPEEATGRVSALQVEVDELRSILETATDGVVLIGEDGIMRSMNRSASALFDYDEDETRGRPFAMLFAHESQRAVQDYLSGLTGNGVASVLNDGREVIGREASGGFLPLFMTIGHLSGSNGYCAVMRDITQWKRAEEELRSAKREAETASSHKSEFLARVSHEIRTPLNAIIGFSDLMAEERFGPIGSPRYVEYAHDIGRSGKHVLDIVNDLLDISKIEAGEQELDFKAVSLNQALLDAVSILQPQANSQRVIIRTSLSSSVPEVVADQRSIKQIAINILSNAIRFTQAGGQVVVSTSYEQNGNVSLRIRDTGVGMTRNQLEQAMKPFKQVTGFRRERGDGTGLGLPLAKAMAEANRAQFAMNSQPGQGTLVEIIFPSQRVLAE